MTKKTTSAMNRMVAKGLWLMGSVSVLASLTGCCETGRMALRHGLHMEAKADEAVMTTSYAPPADVMIQRHARLEPAAQIQMTRGERSGQAAVMPEQGIGAEDAAFTPVDGAATEELMAKNNQ